jgi:ADP-heptose:LPS heptosyltransferase
METLLKKLLYFIVTSFYFKKKIFLKDVPVSSFKRILIIRQHDQLGDLLISTPTIRAVRKHFPDAHIGVVVREYNAPMMWDNPHVDEIFVFYEKLKRWNWQKIQFFFSTLRKDGGYDCAIVLNTVSRSLTSDLIAIASKAKYIVGPNHLKIVPEYPEKIYNVITPRNRKYQSEIEHNLDIVRALGVMPDGFEYDLELSSDENLEADKVIYQLGGLKSRLNVGVHFGTLIQARQFPLKKLAQVIDWMKESYDCEIVLIIGPNEIEQRDELISYLQSKVLSAPLMKIRVAASFMKHLNLFICNDTGTLHIASAIRLPSVSFHGLNDPKIWKPPHPRHIGVRADDKLITSITVDQVKEAIQKTVETINPSARKNIHSGF